MAAENYTEKSNQELLDEVRQKAKTPVNQLGRLVKSRFPGLFAEIAARTSFLEDPNVQFTARLHCLEHGLAGQPKCKMCGNPVGWNGKAGSFRTYCSSKCKNQDKEFWDKVQDTCERKLGARNAFQSEVVKRKIRERNRENLGVDYPMQSESVRLKSMKTCVANLGVENPSMSEEVKAKKAATSLDHYGVEHPFQSEVVKARAASTCIDRWGVDNFSKSPLFHLHHRSRMFHDGLWFDSSWEVKVYEFLKGNGIPFRYHIEPIPYEFDGVTHYYHPDFLVNGRIYEVKGDHFFKVDDGSGKEVMVNPYREPEWSDERYAHECAKFEAKHQCMIANNVVVLRESDIRTLSPALFNVV